LQIGLPTLDPVYPLAAADTMDRAVSVPVVDFDPDSILPASPAIARGVDAAVDSQRQRLAVPVYSLSPDEFLDSRQGEGLEPLA